MATEGPSSNAAPANPARPIIPEGFSSLTEGQATILQRGNDVFYNPAQVVNRDLSISVLNYFSKVRQEEASTTKKRNRNHNAPKPPPNQGEGLSILEGLAASGLRSIRYALEIDNVSSVIANDLDPSVVEAVTRNIEFNGDKVKQIVKPSTGDARLIMLQNPGAYDAVDLDPYGSPSILLDSAVQSVNEGGLLLVTATDMAVLCGNNGEACFGKYGSYPLHKPYCHEMALRILLGAIDSHAARYKRYIVPVLSCSIDFYVRVFVRVYTSAQEVKNSALKKGYVFQSSGCDSFYWQKVGRKIERGNSTKYAPSTGPAVPEKCPDTGSGFTMGGPFWSEPIHDQEAIKGIINYVKTRKPKFQAYDRLIGLLTTCVEELPDAPLYFNLHDVCKTLRCTAPRAETIKSALINAGYKVSGTHCTPLGIKTDAPWSVIWDVMRCWIADHPVKSHPEGSYIATLLAKEPELKADFSRAPMAHANKKMGKQKKVARYLPNPEANWGPKPKHGRTIKPRNLKPPKQVEGEVDGDNDMAVDTNTTTTNNNNSTGGQQTVDETGYDSTLS